jgi:hypothetical protein
MQFRVHLPVAGNTGGPLCLRDVWKKIHSLIADDLVVTHAPTVSERIGNGSTFVQLEISCLNCHFGFLLPLAVSLSVNCYRPSVNFVFAYYVENKMQDI